MSAAVLHDIIRAQARNQRTAIQETFDGWLAAPCAPSPAEIAPLLDRQTIATAVEVLKVGKLNGVIGRTSDFFLITRIAAAFEISAPRAEPFTIEALRRSRSPQVGLALAALGRVPWISATVDQRRVIVQCAFLNAIAARGAS